MTGDVLMIRSGFVDGMSLLPGAEQASLLVSPGSCGIESSMNAANWMRQNKFSAVAGEMIGFERISPTHRSEENYNEGRVKFDEPFILHRELDRDEVPIGELWNLEGLADACNESKRYTCLLTFSLFQGAADKAGVNFGGLAIL